MARKLLENAAILDLLETNLQQIQALAQHAQAAHLHDAPQPGEWSVNEILAHVRACADMWGGCIPQILDEDHPTLRAVDPRTWARQTHYEDLPFTQSLAAFVAQRLALIERLAALEAAQWTRAATVRGAGAPLERTVHFYAQWLATHERTHARQMLRTLQSFDAA